MEISEGIISGVCDNVSVLSSLVCGGVRLQIPLTDTKSIRGEEVAGTSAALSSALLFESDATKKLKEIQEKCKNDLLEICNTIASEKKITVSSLINMQAITAMAEKLPESEQDMLNIPHVTKANYEKVCKQLLSVTRHYSAKRMGELKKIKVSRRKCSTIVAFILLQP